jgi:hypothetical protein
MAVSATRRGADAPAGAPKSGSRSPPDPRAVSPSRNPAKGAAAAGFSGGEPAGREAETPADVPPTANFCVAAVARWASGFESEVGARLAKAAEPD